MTFINTIPACEATGDVLELYQRQQGGLDYLPNYARVPDALGALPDAPLGELTEPRRTLLTVGRLIAVEQQNPRPFTRCFQRGHGIL